MRRFLFVLSLLLLAVPASAQLLTPTQVEHVTTYVEGTTSACWEDLDGDGDLDLVTSHPTGFIRVLQHGVLENDEVAFGEVARIGEVPNAATALCIDLTNDGFPDIVVAGLSSSVGVIANDAGVMLATPAFIASPATANARDIDAGDLDGDGFLDLVVARRDGSPDVLLYNAGRGTFEAAPAEVFSAERLNSTAASLMDYDDDGDLDLLVTALEANRLYRNDRGVLRRVEGAAVEGQRGSISPSWGDVDADGDLDLYIAGQQENVLYRNQGGLLSIDQTFPAEAAATSSSAWFDVDLDRRLDLVQSRNGAAGQVLVQEPGVSEALTFTPEPFGTGGVNAALAVADLGADGRADVLVARGGFDADQADYLYTAAPSDQAWLNVRLQGVRSNRQGIGAQVFATDYDAAWQRQRRPIVAKLGRRGNSGTLAHFGLAEAELVDLEIRWPSGQVQVLKEVEVNQRLTVTESDAPASIAAIPTASTRLPAEGRTLAYTLRGINLTDEAQTYDLWAYAFRPDGTRFGPVVGPVEVTLEPGARVDEPMRARLGRDAPPGVYLGTAYLGDFETETAVSESSLHFRKEAGPPLRPWVWTTEFVASGEVQEVPVEAANPVATDPAATPDRLTLAGNFPNPFTDATRISYTLPHAAPVRLQVYDVTGRLVRVLVDEVQTAGAHSAEWNARDTRGTPVASGVYVYRLGSDVGSMTRRMVVVR